MFVAFMAGFISSAANAQDANNQSPILLVKIRNIERFLSDMGTFMPQSAQQISSLRAMLQGTSWIDSERSITAGMVLEGTKTRWILLIPFRTANATVQTMLNANVRKDYYLAVIPPQPNAVVSPSIEETLAHASATPVIGSLTLEVSPVRMLPIIETQMEAAFKQMEATQPPPAAPSGLAPLEPRAVLSDMLNLLKQVDTLRMGMDLSGSMLTLQYDIDALPDTLLARILTDPGGDTRLMHFASDLPILFRSRAPRMTDMVELANMIYGRLYSQMGIDLNAMSALNDAFTGEFAGGIAINANGIAMEGIYILQPGINGEDFLLRTYLSWIEQTGHQLSGLLASQPGSTPAPFYERTPDSIVDGLTVIGFKHNLKGLLPATGQNPAAFDKLVFEMRLASAGDMLFVASDDVKIKNLIEKARGLAMTPAQGPTTELDIKLGALLKGIQFLIPPTGPSVDWPEDIGNLKIQAEMRDGKVTSRTSINIDEIGKLFAAIKAQTIKN